MTNPRLEQFYPCCADMEARARRRMPRFAHDYLVGGLGREDCVRRNVAELRDVLLLPRYLTDAARPDLRATLFGQAFDAPFGAAPLGLAGLLWPGCELPIAAAAREHNVLHVLSTFSNRALEAVRPVCGDVGWFQLYPPSDPDMEQDLVARAWRAGYRTLVVTVDIPVAARRERDIRNGLSIPLSFGLATLLQVAARPRWAMRLARHGIPDFENLSPYYPAGGSVRRAAEFVARVMQGHLTPQRIRAIRAAWPGQLVIKGVLDPDEALAYVALGADALVISNHGGRQLDAAPSAVSVLPEMRRRLGREAVLLADGGVRSGLDIARLIALGADYVLVGRPFVIAAAALGDAGPGHLVQLLKAELGVTLAQLGCSSVAELPRCIRSPGRS
jgi:L-lactate dehydrogenase (cytochrome)